MPEYTERTIVTVYLPLFKSICGKKSAGKMYLDGWMDKITKKKAKTIFTYEGQSIITVYP